MQLVVNINGTRLTALLDSGSTHNFVDVEAAVRASIQLGAPSGLHVAVANDMLDILIYSTSWSEQLWHIHLVLAKLQEHRLYVKRSKSAFSEHSVAYLGHVISADRVVMDAKKVQVVLDWLVPRLAFTIRAFLGLTGYYRCFIQGYGDATVPLTRLLHKEGFRWSTEAKVAFRAL
jgi:hypothetical protein